MNLNEYINKVSEEEVIFNNKKYKVEYSFNNLLNRIIKDNKNLKIKKAELISALYNF